MIKEMPEEEDSILMVPFEWFDANNLQRTATLATGDVLVLWLNADAFADYPTKRLAQLNHELRTHTPNSPLRFKLIDPGLYSIIQEESAAGGRSSVINPLEVPVELAGLEIYSSWATSADAVLKPGAKGVRGDDIQAVIGRITSMNMVNVTCTDDQLAEELIDELELRN